MGPSGKCLVLAALLGVTSAGIPLEKRQEASGYGFENGQPQSSSGKGAPLLGGTDRQIDLANPANLGEESTDNGVVPNLKWRFSDSKTRLLPGGWVREQVITDLPVSTDIAAAQQHLQKGAIREIHWHRVAEWGWVYAGRVTVSAVVSDKKKVSFAWTAQLTDVLASQHRMIKAATKSRN